MISVSVGEEMKGDGEGGREEKGGYFTEMMTSPRMAQRGRARPQHAPNPLHTGTDPNILLKELLACSFFLDMLRLEPDFLVPLRASEAVVEGPLVVEAGDEAARGTCHLGLRAAGNVDGAFAAVDVQAEAVVGVFAHAFFCYETIVSAICVSKVL